MTKEPTDTHDTHDTQDTHVRTSVDAPDEEHCGIIRIDSRIIRELVPEITVDLCDTQGVLRERGLFTKLHEALLLPESYTIRGIFLEQFGRVWVILVESSELHVLPSAYATQAQAGATQPGSEYPLVEPLYCKHADGTVTLVELQVHAQYTYDTTIIGFRGGIEALVRGL